MGSLRKPLRRWTTVDEFKSNAPHVPIVPQVGLAFARLAVIDVALRVAAFRSYHQLGPLESLAEDAHAGLLIRRLLTEAELTREKFECLDERSDNSVDAWCDGKSRMNEDNILKVAKGLSSNPPTLAARLRRHYAWWALRGSAVAVFWKEAAADLFSALIRLANKLLDGLSRSRLPPEQRRMTEVGIIFMGRCFESTRFLRNHASRTEQDGHWIEALTVNDIDYVIGHARRVAAIPEVRARFVAQGADMDLVDRIAQMVTSGPRIGFVPQTGSNRQYVYRLSGDAQFTVNVRDAQAEEALLRGDLDGAVVHRRRQVALQPEKAMWHFKLGTVLSQRGDYEEALAECWLAAQIEPTWELPRVEIGVIHLDAGHAEKAVEELEVARTLFETPSARLLYHLGVGYFREGRLCEADEALKAALSVKGDDALTQELAAVVAYHLDDTLRCRKLAREAAHRGRPFALELLHPPKRK